MNRDRLLIVYVYHLYLFIQFHSWICTLFEMHSYTPLFVRYISHFTVNVNVISDNTRDDRDYVTAGSLTWRSMILTIT